MSSFEPLLAKEVLVSIRCKSLNIDKIFESLQEKLQMDGVPQVQLVGNLAVTCQKDLLQFNSNSSFF